MRVARSTLSAWAVLACAAIPRLATAQTIPSPYSFIEERQEAGLFAGWAHAGTGRFGYGPKGGPLYGLRYAVDLAGPLSLEGSASIIDGTRDVVSPTRPEGDRVIGEAESLVTTIDARLRLQATGARTWHGLSPFLLFGAGVAFDLADRSITEAILDPDELFTFGTKFTAMAGPGVRWSVTRHLAVRGDLSLQLWQLKTPSGFGDPALGFQNVAESEWVSSVSFSASLLFRW
jgi:hypothetical protein